MSNTKFVFPELGSGGSFQMINIKVMLTFKHNVPAVQWITWQQHHLHKTVFS
jgi:hypothetical protein